MIQAVDIHRSLPLPSWYQAPPAKRSSTPNPRLGKGGQAKILSEKDLHRVLAHIEHRRQSPEADRVKLFLSFAAGLRAGEIAELRISDVTNPDGSTADVISIRRQTVKGKARGREIPMCLELRQAIDEFRAKYPGCEWLAVSHRRRVVRHQNANGVTCWFHKLYRECGLEKCSSHSGRRTFITLTSRNLPPDCSLRDVQYLAGHARLDTTQLYIECSPNVRKLVHTLGSFIGRSEASK